MIGTPWLPDLTDHVLMIEEVSEPLYRIDRMLFQLAHATQLRGLVGIRLGAIRDVQQNDPPFAETPEQMDTPWCVELGVPYPGTAAIGHDWDKPAVPFGAFGRGRAGGVPASGGEWRRRRGGERGG